MTVPGRTISIALRPRRNTLSSGAKDLSDLGHGEDYRLFYIAVKEKAEGARRLQKWARSLIRARAQLCSCSVARWLRLPPQYRSALTAMVRDHMFHSKWSMLSLVNYWPRLKEDDPTGRNVRLYNHVKKSMLAALGFNVGTSDYWWGRVCKFTLRDLVPERRALVWGMLVDAELLPSGAGDAHAALIAPFDAYAEQEHHEQGVYHITDLPPHLGGGGYDRVFSLQG